MTARPNVDEIEARAQAATEGPWEPCTEWKEGRGWLAIGPQTETGDHDDCEGDAYFIAAARTDVPALCAYVRELEAALDTEEKLRHTDNDEWRRIYDERDQAVAERDAARREKGEIDREYAILARTHCEVEAERDAARADVEALRARAECGGRNVDLTDPNDACQSARVQAARTEKAESDRAADRELQATTASLLNDTEAGYEDLARWAYGLIDGATCAFCHPNLPEEKRLALREHVVLCMDHPAFRLAEEAADARVEVASLKNHVAEVEAQAAAMREALRDALDALMDADRQVLRQEIRAALAADAGRALLAEVEALRGALEEALDDRHCVTSPDGACIAKRLCKHSIEAQPLLAALAKGGSR